MFVTEDGGPVSRHHRRWWRDACRTAGLSPTTHLHDLRHAGLTLAAQSGATLKELMALAGHSSPRAALVYQHAAQHRAARSPTRYRGCSSVPVVPTRPTRAAPCAPAGRTRGTRGARATGSDALRARTRRGPLTVRRWSEALSHGGAEGTRTPDPHTASVVRYQLRHSPVVRSVPYRLPRRDRLGGARPPGGLLQRRGAGTVPLQPPAARVLDEHREAGVAERREPPPLRRVGLEQSAEDAASGAAVRHRDEHPAGRQVGQRLEQAGGGAGAGLGVRLAAAARRVPALAPGAVLVRVAIGGLRGGEPLPGAEVQLAQPGVRRTTAPVGLGQRGRGRRRPRQVAAQQDGRAGLREDVARPRRPAAAPDLVERGVELALEAAAGVVGGAPVPQQDQPPRRRTRGRRAQGATWARLAAPESRSTNSMTGQSFHSRSSA